MLFTTNTMYRPVMHDALFLLESESESEISKGAGIGTGIRIREFSLGIGIRNFKSDHILIKVLGLESECNRWTSCWNRNWNQTFEFSWNRNRNRNQDVPGIVHHWYRPQTTVLLILSDCIFAGKIKALRLCLSHFKP